MNKENKELVVGFSIEGYLNHNYDYIMECVAENDPEWRLIC